MRLSPERFFEIFAWSVHTDQLIWPSCRTAISGGIFTRSQQEHRHVTLIAWIGWRIFCRLGMHGPLSLCCYPEVAYLKRSGHTITRLVSSADRSAEWRVLWPVYYHLCLTLAYQKFGFHPLLKWTKVENWRRARSHLECLKSCNFGGSMSSLQLRFGKD